MALTDAQLQKLVRVAQLQKFKQLADTVYYPIQANGIPSTDLASDVQAALTAAGTALQSSDLSELNSKVAALEALITADDPRGAIDKFNEIVAFLDGIDATTLDGILTTINSNIAAKYTKPATGIPATDLAQGVQDSLALADSALQAADIAGKAEKSEMSISAGTGDNADKTTIQLKSGLSATVLTTHQDISGKANVATTLGGYGITDANIANGVITLGSNTITPLTEHQDISGKANKSEMSVTAGTGTNAGKTTIQLKDGTSATVLNGDYATDSDIEAIFA